MRGPLARGTRGDDTSTSSGQAGEEDHRCEAGSKRWPCWARASWAPASPRTWPTPGSRASCSTSCPRKLTDEDEKAGLTASDQRFRNKFALTGLEAIQKAPPGAPLLAASSCPSSRSATSRTTSTASPSATGSSRSWWSASTSSRSSSSGSRRWCKPGTIVSSNTSGLPISKMMRRALRGVPQELPGHPLLQPRPLHAPARARRGRGHRPAGGEGSSRTSAPSASARASSSGKDTPNFVANRIGVFGMMATLHAMLEMGYRVDEVDAITGPRDGPAQERLLRHRRPRGSRHLRPRGQHPAEGCPEDEGKRAFKIPELLTKMVARAPWAARPAPGFFKQ